MELEMQTTPKWFDILKEELNKEEKENPSLPTHNEKETSN